MDKRAHTPTSLRRFNIKVFSISLAALALIVLSLSQSGVLRQLIENGRSRISRLMTLDHINWEEVGTSNLSSRVTKDLLMSVSGLKRGEEMLKIDMSGLESKLSSIPWIESLQIQKKLPSTIDIRYTVHDAYALSLRKGKLWLISSAGKWIAPLGRDASLDLPVLAQEDSLFLELEWLIILEKELGPQLLQVHEVRFSGQKPEEKARGSALIELQYPSRSVKILVVANGRPAAETVSRLKRVVQYLIKNNILVSTVDLRPGKKVVVNVGKRP